MITGLKDNYRMLDSQTKEDDPEPFSIHDYLLYMCEDKVWADYMNSIVVIYVGM